jgi:hypothetical protein
MKPGSIEKPADIFTMRLALSPCGMLLTMSWGDRSWMAELNATR